ncbi:non-receptor tyrosine kinase [Tieghemostelium lacteum]|uniref:Non-receptor tyrosine kinase n=1 Tax=Tieghemostelium lacteum TaxID=361077 RepID=A0A151ZI22_TIELA|nr:non-receptor tyrosine kinase [Tieghemostelium lacteum]|eukprot:KYQ93648.1 non-receptor tyrosine kinase [Tieghemostelium lacteum]
MNRPKRIPSPTNKKRSLSDLTNSDPEHTIIEDDISVDSQNLKFKKSISKDSIECQESGSINILASISSSPVNSNNNNEISPTPFKQENTKPLSSLLNNDNQDNLKLEIPIEFVTYPNSSTSINLSSSTSALKKHKPTVSLPVFNLSANGNGSTPNGDEYPILKTPTSIASASSTPTGFSNAVGAANQMNEVNKKYQELLSEYNTLRSTTYQRDMEYKEQISELRHKLQYVNKLVEENTSINNTNSPRGGGPGSVNAPSNSTSNSTSIDDGHTITNVDIMKEVMHIKQVLFDYNIPGILESVHRSSIYFSKFEEMMKTFFEYYRFFTEQNFMAIEDRFETIREKFGELDRVAQDYYHNTNKLNNSKFIHQPPQPPHQHQHTPIHPQQQIHLQQQQQQQQQQNIQKSSSKGISQGSANSSTPIPTSPVMKSIPTHPHFPTKSPSTTPPQQPVKPSASANGANHYKYPMPTTPTYGGAHHIHHGMPSPTHNPPPPPPPYPGSENYDYRPYYSSQNGSNAPSYF